MWGLSQYRSGRLRPKLGSLGPATGGHRRTDRNQVLLYGFAVDPQFPGDGSEGFLREFLSLDSCLASLIQGCGFGQA